MKTHSKTGLDVRKKARKFMLIGTLTIPFIIIIYHNYFSEEISKIDFFGALLILFVLLATSTSDKSRKIKHKISQIEDTKNIKNPYEIIDFLNKSNNPELSQLKNKYISIYYESSFILGISIPFVFSMFTYFMKG